MSTVEELQSLHEARARAEIATADALIGDAASIAWSGTVFARTALVKGRPGPVDLSERRALAGPDGEAAEKALQALGLGPDAIFATIGIPADTSLDRARYVDRLALQLEAVDPASVIALDEEAAALVADVAGLDGLPFGTVRQWKGRDLLAVDGLEASLSDETRKKRVWRQFTALSTST